MIFSGERLHYGGRRPPRRWRREIRSVRPGHGRTSRPTSAPAGSAARRSWLLLLPRVAFASAFAPRREASTSTLHKRAELHRPAQYAGKNTEQTEKQPTQLYTHSYGLHTHVPTRRRVKHDPLALHTDTSATTYNRTRINKTGSTSNTRTTCFPVQARVSVSIERLVSHCDTSEKPRVSAKAAVIGRPCEIMPQLWGQTEEASRTQLYAHVSTPYPYGRPRCAQQHKREPSTTGGVSHRRACLRVIGRPAACRHGHILSLPAYHPLAFSRTERARFYGRARGRRKTRERLAKLSKWTRKHGTGRRRGWGPMEHRLIPNIRVRMSGGGELEIPRTTLLTGHGLQTQ
ncbi:unnamed protein product [Trichogramma brassicae]|uniref:Uncharacterized protein n=1 Tax=Trichogramma brassicae TaxID=86971 RepID=A0A6H5I038_9HYME|nr:unnamed protein product [Trichogramma brassicae]